MRHLVLVRRATVPVSAALAAVLVTAVPVRSTFAHEGHDHGADAARPATATAGTAAAPKANPQHDAMMAEMEKLGRPGPQHALMKGMEGMWKAEVAVWSAPGGEPQRSEGVMENKLILGGRCLEGRFRGTFFGKEMNGYSLMGYDNLKQEWWSFWVDDVSTGNLLQTGKASADGKEWVLKGDGPGQDGKPTTYTSTTRVIDATSHVFTMSSRVAGQDVKMMEITNRR